MIPSHKVHGLLDGGLHQLLDLLLDFVGQVMRRAARPTGTSPVAGSQFVVVLPGSLRHQVGVVGGGGVRDCPGQETSAWNMSSKEFNQELASPGAPRVEVTEVVGQDLQLVSREVTVVPQDVVVAGAGGALDTLVAGGERS